MTEPNAVERRLARVREQYLSFASDADARLLHWVIRDDERRMIDVFIKVEALEGRTQDLLLVLDTPFDEPALYGSQLVAEMAQMYDAMREPLRAAGLPKADWSPPARKSHGPEAGIEHLRLAAESFHKEHQPLLERLSLVIAPPSIADPSALGTWLKAAASAFVSPSTRLVLPDLERAPVLVDPPQDGGIRTVRADLDMPGCMEELSAEAGLDSPAAQFRHANIQMGNAIGRGDIAIAKKHAGDACKIADAHGWDHLAISVWFTLASGYLGQKNFVDSMNGFRKAEAIAAKAKKKGEPWATQLHLHAWLGEGSVAVSAQSWVLGAEIYGAKALPVAKEMADARMQIECLRMAAYCNERHNEFQLAWDQSVAACVVGRSMTPPERESTTLAFVGEAMLRISKQRGFDGYEAVVEQEMRAQLGDDWRSKASVGTPPPDPDPAHPSPLEENPPVVRTIDEAQAGHTP